MRSFIGLIITAFCGVLTLLASSIYFVEAKSDLAPDAPIQIGRTFVPDECPFFAETGDKVTVHYTGTLLKDGKIFDSSWDRGEPFQGWEMGIPGMCISETRRIKIPSNLGYGDAGSPPTIPGKATLVFDIKLLDIPGKTMSMSPNPMEEEDELVDDGLGEAVDEADTEIVTPSEEDDDEF